jgi:hypothetical protein
MFITTCFLLSGCNLMKIMKYSNKEEYVFKNEVNKFKYVENQILVNTSFSDKLNVELLFDLGAGLSTIFIDSTMREIISSQKPIASPGRSISADGVKMHNDIYRLGDIITPWFTVKNSFILATNRPNIYPCYKIKGLWGTSSFAPSFRGKRNKIIILNMQDTTLAIIDSLPSLNDWIPIEAIYNKVSSLFQIKIALGHESFYFLFDTGCTGNIIMTRKDFKAVLRNSHSLINRASSYGYITNSLSGTKIDTAEITYSNISIGAIKLDSVPIYSTKALAMNIVGMEFINRFNILVDYQHHKIYLQPNTNYKKPEPTFYKAKGFSPRNTINSGFCIQNILSDSPAEKAGLKVGDKIISINNISAETGDICEIEKIFSRLDGKNTNNKIIVRRGNEILNFTL